MSIRVLVTGAGALLGQGILRSLRRSNRDYYVIGVDPSPLSAGLYWADKRYLVPMATDENYLTEVEKVIVKERPDVLLIGTDVELLIFAEQRERLEADHKMHVVVSNPNVVAIADDKFKTYEFLKEHQFPYPKSALADGAHALVETIGFPIVAKPRVGARSVGVHLIHNTKELEHSIATTKDFVFQELAGPENREYTAGVICFDGRCLASVVMRRDLRDGNTYRAFVDPSPELNEQIQKMGAALNPYGPANFQFRTDADGIPRVFEINGRFSGTTPLRALAGFDEVEMCIRYLVHGEPIVQPEVANKIFLRHWSETEISQNELDGPWGSTD